MLRQTPKPPRSYNPRTLRRSRCFARDSRWHHSKNPIREFTLTPQVYPSTIVRFISTAVSVRRSCACGTSSLSRNCKRR